MGGSATLDGSLVDSLVSSVVDPLRASLYPAMGIQPYAVHIVTRVWSGSRRGQGSPTILSDVTLDPPPMVREPRNQGALHYEASPVGRQEEGAIILTEVSLTYTEAELTGEPISLKNDFYYKIVDAHGQQIKDRYYVPSAPPTPDREKNIGWEIQLKRVEISES